MAQDKLNLTTPMGRFVQGDLVKPNTTDAEGQPLVVKHGPNAGQPRQEFFLALAVPKAGEADWRHTDWGRQIVEIAKRDFPSLFDPNTGEVWPGRTFAWKIDDGDSQVPNRNGNRNCDRPGFPGHWILRFSSGYAPSTFNSNGTLPEPAENFYRGCYVQVNGNISGNGNTNQPGLYLNLSMVAFSGHGEQIQTGPDPKAAGFGSGPAPAGMSQTPVGGMATGQQQPAAPAPQPGVQQAAPAPAPQPQAPAPQPQQPVQPAHDLVQPGAQQAAPAPAPQPQAPAPQPGNAGAPPNPPAPAPAPVVQYNLNGTLYTGDQLRAAGWDDAQISALPQA